MNKYEELIYSLIYNCKREINKEEMEMLNQAGAIYNTYNQLTEQLGCSLEVAIKALEGFYYKNYVGGICEADRPITISITNKTEVILECGDNEWTSYHCFLLADYKKTWWLKEDKSE